MVCFIHRPEYYKIYKDAHGNDTKGIAEIIIAKHRNGAVGTVRLRFKDEYARFENEEEDDGGVGASNNAGTNQGEFIGSRVNGPQELPPPAGMEALPPSADIPFAAPPPGEMPSF